MFYEPADGRDGGELKNTCNYSLDSNIMKKKVTHVNVYHKHT